MDQTSSCAAYTSSHSSPPKNILRELFPPDTHKPFFQQTMRIIFAFFPTTVCAMVFDENDHPAPPEICQSAPDTVGDPEAWHAAEMVGEACRGNVLTNSPTAGRTFQMSSPLSDYPFTIFVYAVVVVSTVFPYCGRSLWTRNRSSR